MKIGVMSDSHGDYGAVERAIEIAGEVDLWLHAGDLCGDAEHLAACSGIRAISVAGNCDGLAALSPNDEFIELAGKRIWLTHGHMVQVKYGLEKLLERAWEYEADVAIYGHTHVVDISQHGKLLVLNPGSVARPRYTKASFIKLFIANGELSTELVEIP